jgi:hypothetical protein
MFSGLVDAYDFLLYTQKHLMMKQKTLGRSVAAEFIKNKNRLCNWQDEPRQTTNKPLRMFVTGPAGAGKCKQQYYSVPLSLTVSDDANQSILFKLLEEVLAYAKLFSQKSAILSAGRQTTCYSNDMSSCYGDRWSNSFGIPLHAKQKLCYAR